MNKSKATPSQLWLEHVYDSDLSGPAKAVAAFLKSRMYNSKLDCFVSVETVASKIGFVGRTVQRAKKELKQEGWLSETWLKGRQAPTLTALTPDTQSPCQKVTRDRESPVTESHHPPDTESPEVVTEVVKNIYRFKPPTVDEVKAYCDEKWYAVDPETFVDWNTSKGWMIGKNKMKDWKAAVRTWNKRGKQNGQGNRKLPQRSAITTLSISGNTGHDFVG